jgi:hypothetical protein
MCWPSIDLPAAPGPSLSRPDNSLPATRASCGRDPAVPVHLRTVLGTLDTRTITLVAAAITTANG